MSVKPIVVKHQVPNAVFEPMRDEYGYVLKDVRVYFNILPESNPIHVKDILKELAQSVSHINKGKYMASYDIQKEMTMLDLECVPENRVEEVKSIIEEKLINYKNQNAINSYIF